MSISAIRKRYSGPGWIVLDEVADATGGNVRRFADAIAYGIWPSNGLVLHGFEFKASRADLMNEIKDPSKSDGVGKYCDFWWLVVTDAKIIETVELPATWGVFVSKNGVLKKIKDAPQRVPMPLSRSFTAALLRRALDKGSVDIAEELRKEREIRNDVIDDSVKTSRAYHEKTIAELDAERKKNARYETAARAFRGEPDKVIECMAKVSHMEATVKTADQRLENIRRMLHGAQDALADAERATSATMTKSRRFFGS